MDDKAPILSVIQQGQIPPGTIKQRHLAATTKIANGDLLYGDGDNNFTRLPVGTNGQVLTVALGVPAYATPATPNPTVSGSLQSVQQTTTRQITSTSSTSDVTFLTLTFTPSASANLLVLFSVNWYQSSASGTNYADITLDGSVQGTNPMLQTDFSAATHAETISGQYYISGVSAASHTVAINVRVGSGTMSFNSGLLTVLVFNA